VTVESVHGDLTFDTVGANLQAFRRGWLHGDQRRSTVSLRFVRGGSWKARGEFDQRNMQMLHPPDSVRVQTSSGNILFDGVS